MKCSHNLIEQLGPSCLTDKDRSRGHANHSFLSETQWDHNVLFQSVPKVVAGSYFIDFLVI